MRARIWVAALLLAGGLNAQDVIEGVTLHFKRTPAQQKALEDLLEAQHTPGNAQFHKWITPEEFGKRFGPSEADLTRVRRWAQRHGLKVDYEAAGRTFWTASGNQDGVSRALGVSLKREAAGSRRRFHRMGRLSLSFDVSDVIETVTGLDDIEPRPQAILSEPAANSGDGSHYLAPDDYATIYNIAPALNRGVDGSGVRVVVVGQSAINIEDMRAFRRRFNLPDNDPEVILYAGSADPGRLGGSSELEANLDLQWAGAIARRARITYVYGTSALRSAMFAIDRNLAPIISVSFTIGCEAEYSTSTNNALRTTVQQANAQGITWVNASGDAGPAGCDGNRASIAQNGFAVEAPNGIPEITSIGGTELNDRNGTYWRANNDGNGASALGYIPEAVWNQSRRGSSLSSAGSGVSMFYPRPVWQSGPGVGGESQRTVPDVSLAASTYNGYSVTFQGRNVIVGGTSAGTPAFAAMLALLLQGTGQAGFGNVNRILYPLAEGRSEAFHDVSSGNNRVPCVAGSVDCAEGVFGYSAASGYDLAAGLGSVDFDRLLEVWPRGAATQSLVTVTSTNNPVYMTTSAQGSAWVATIALREHAGVSTTLTSFQVDGVEQLSGVAAALGSAVIRANGSGAVSLTNRSLTPPVTRTLFVSGVDANGQTWTRTIYVNYTGAPVVPRITAIANAASYAQAFAPGSILSAFGTNLAKGTQAAGALPLTRISQGLIAAVNGEIARFYYVSPTQVNLQIPYEVRPGSATLTLSIPQQGSSTYDFTVGETAPGIFTDADLYTVPQKRCGRGETCILFVTGQGAVSPAVRTGEAPSSTAIVDLPRPLAQVTMTIGDVPVEVVFAGIPPGLVGVMQVNFTVAGNTPVGSQRVVVKVGNTESAGAKIDVF